MGARRAANLLKFRGSVVIYTMPQQTNLNDRLRGYQDVFEVYPQIKIAEVVDIKGDPRVVFDKTTELIEKNVKVDAFVCLASIAGPEVSEVLERKRVSGKVVVAMDTDARTLEGIQKAPSQPPSPRNRSQWRFTGSSCWMICTTIRCLR
jgi:ribose transport system substrate-binding protein